MGRFLLLTLCLVVGLAPSVEGRTTTISGSQAKKAKSCRDGISTKVGSKAPRSYLDVGSCDQLQSVLTAAADLYCSDVIVPLYRLCEQLEMLKCMPHTLCTAAEVQTAEVRKSVWDEKELEGHGKVATDPVLRPALVENKVWKLIPGYTAAQKFEASGICRRGGDFYVIFDNMKGVARIGALLEENGKGNVFVGEDIDSQYEGIACGQESNKMYVAVESQTEGGKLMPAIDEYHPRSLEFIRRSIAQIPLVKENTGVEGLTMIPLKGTTTPYLLALCEGNNCQYKNKAHAGSGVIYVLKYNKPTNQWLPEHYLKVPHTANFVDYSGVDIDKDGNIGIVSQESAALWVGKINLETFTWENKGRVVRFPLTEAGEVQYCNVEGFVWLGGGFFAIATDKPKRTQPEVCWPKGQSLAVFHLDTQL